MTRKLTGLIPVPTCCHVCASDNIGLRPVRDKNFGWVCYDCDAFVSCHKGLKNPVGYMADKQTRKYRKLAHVAFDRIWREDLMSRDKAYVWLANKLGITREQSHISWLSKDQLKDTIVLAENLYENSAEQLAKRQQKKKTKKVKRHARRNKREHRSTIERRKGRRN